MVTYLRVLILKYRYMHFWNLDTNPFLFLSKLDCLHFFNICLLFPVPFTAAKFCESGVDEFNSGGTAFTPTLAKNKKTKRVDGFPPNIMCL